MKPSRAFVRIARRGCCASPMPWQHVHILGVAHSSFDQCDIARATMFDVGDRRPVEFGDLRQFEYALVDVEKRRVAAEAAGERGRGDAHLGQGGGFRGRAHLVRICHFLSYDMPRNESEGRSKGSRSMCDFVGSLTLWSGAD